MSCMVSTPALTCFVEIPPVKEKKEIKRGEGKINKYLNARQAAKDGALLALVVVVNGKFGSFQLCGRIVQAVFSFGVNVK